MMDHSDFISRYPPASPALASANSDEDRELTSIDGVRLLGYTPHGVVNDNRHVPGQSGDKGCHLWVINRTGIPYVLELAQVVPRLASGKVKHTNLTGGGLAACGGEIWFDPVNDAKVYLNGCSGRYGPRTEEKLNDAVAVVRDLGYNVISFGWDHDVDLPARVLRE